MIPLWMATAALAAEPVGIPGVEPGPPPPADQVDANTREVASGLRCPVCQGLSVADSSSKTSIEMHLTVRELVAAGYSKEQINAFFVSRYGEWVLLAPESSHWIVWLAPLLVGGLGIAWIGSLVVGSRKKSNPAGAPVAPKPSDDYERQLLAEVDE